MKKILGVLGLATVLACSVGVSSASAGNVTPDIPPCYWDVYGEWVCPY